MNILYTFVQSVWNISSLMSLYIIVGLLTAGIIHEFVSDSYIKKHLGGRGLMSSVRAAVIGIPLPVCSCGVIPLAASLRKSGAGKGAVTSFFISTPMTGADSIIATYGVFGWIITAFRVVSAFLSAVVAGALTDMFDREEAPEPEEQKSCGCASSCCSGEKVEEKKTVVSKIKSIFSYAFVELLGDMAFPLLLGLLIAGLITMLITPDTMSGVTGGVWMGYFAALAVGIPLYVCSVSAIPVALSLVLAGFTPGAAFIFLAAAPATNIVTINIVRQFLGKKAVAVYLFSIMFFTLASAVVIDMLFADGGHFASSFSGEKEGGTVYHGIAAGILLIYLVYKSVRQKLSIKTAG
ncbi:MAG: SO_0444 family Cu/Zn efflux transporter [Deferribacterales bacterium]